MPMVVSSIHRIVPYLAVISTDRSLIPDAGSKAVNGQMPATMVVS